MVEWVTLKIRLKESNLTGHRGAPTMDRKDKAKTTLRTEQRTLKAVCIFRSGLRQHRDRKFCISLQKCNWLPQTHTSNTVMWISLNLRGSITVWLTSCLLSSDLAAFYMSNEQLFYLFGQIQSSQTGGQPYGGTYPYGEYCMVLVIPHG